MKRVVRLAERLAHGLLERHEVLADLRLHLGRLGATGEVDLAGVRRDDESRRHRQPHPSHLREIRPFASEQVLEILVAFGEVVDELGHGKTSGGTVRESARRLDQQPTYLTHHVPQVIVDVPQVTPSGSLDSVSYTHLRAHETVL